MDKKQIKKKLNIIPINISLIFLKITNSKNQKLKRKLLFIFFLIKNTMRMF